MKKNVLTILSLVVGLFGSAANSNGQTLLHYWNFNVDSASALTPTYSMIPGATLVYIGAYYDTVQQGTTVNGVGADGTTLTASSAAIRLRNPADSFSIWMPTTGHKNIVLAYAEQRTKKGSQQNTVEYSTDGGVTWKNTAIAATATYWVDSTDTVSNTPFQLENFDFSSDTTVNDNPNFRVHIIFSVGDTGLSGNDRFDNITLRGDTITAPTAGVSSKFVTNGCSLHPNPTTDNIEISSVSEGDKSVVIINEIGQTMYTGTASGKRFTVNTSRFAAGSYYVGIRENGTGVSTSLKFVKR